MDKMTKLPSSGNLSNSLILSVGCTARMARRLGVDRTSVSRVAKGERHSPEIKSALVLVQSVEKNRAEVR